MSVEKTPIAILISGRGSNATALIRACEDPSFPARICLVLSNNPDAPGLEMAKKRACARWQSTIVILAKTVRRMNAPCTQP